ncbi:MAG TPA: DUF805 domain-containing protein [Candidatus Paceibacterota bacterium]|nr:DUF805 domain-containing protein [Candidatus Paceibacterota bacterium]
MTDQNTTPSSAPEPGQGSGTSGQGGAPKQSAEAEIKKLAADAKNATQGFSFDRLFEGRLDQMNYFYGALIALVASYILMMIPVIGWIVSFGLAVIGVGMSARRFRDTGVTGWAGAAVVVPIAGLLVVIYLCWKHGDSGPNVYGAAPDPKREMFRAILNT